jgi:hypothetical protein
MNGRRESEYGSRVDDWTPMEKVGQWIIFLALGVLIVWLTFAFWNGPGSTAVLYVPRRFWPHARSGRAGAAPTLLKHQFASSNLRARDWLGPEADLDPALN